jgi:hypothetical protein
MLITGIGFHISGSNYIQYAYYLLTILFIIIFPIFIVPIKNKRVMLKFTQSEFIVQKRISVSKNQWQNIELITLQKGVLKIKLLERKSIKNYFIEPDDKLNAEIRSFIENLKLEFGYKYQVKVIAE